jgi:hypothetical protein
MLRPMTCQACGRELLEGDLFCGHCGTRLEVVRQAPDDVEQPTRGDVTGSRRVSIHHETPSQDESYVDAEHDNPGAPDGPGTRVRRVSVWKPRRWFVLATLAAVAVASLVAFLGLRQGDPDRYFRVNALLAALSDHGIECPEPVYLTIPTSGADRGMESVLCRNDLWVYSFPDASSARARLDRERAAALNFVPPVPYTVVAGPGWFVYPPGLGDPLNPPDPAAVAAIREALGGQVETSPVWVSQASECWEKVNDAVGAAMEAAFRAGRTVDEAYSGGLLSLGSATPEGRIFSDLFLEQVQLAYQGQPPADFVSESAQRCRDHYKSGGA